MRGAGNPVRVLHRRWRGDCEFARHGDVHGGRDAGGVLHRGRRGDLLDACRGMHGWRVAVDVLHGRGNRNLPHYVVHGRSNAVGVLHRLGNGNLRQSIVHGRRNAVAVLHGARGGLHLLQERGVHRPRHAVAVL